MTVNLIMISTLPIIALLCIPSILFILLLLQVCLLHINSIIKQRVSLLIYLILIFIGIHIFIYFRRSSDAKQCYFYMITCLNCYIVFWITRVVKNKKLLKVMKTIVLLLVAIIITTLII